MFRNISFYTQKNCDSPRESLWTDHCLLSGISETQTPKEGGFAIGLIFGDTLLFFLFLVFFFLVFTLRNQKKEQENYHNMETSQGKRSMWKKVKFFPQTLDSLPDLSSLRGSAFFSLLLFPNDSRKWRKIFPEFSKYVLCLYIVQFLKASSVKKNIRKIGFTFGNNLSNLPKDKQHLVF